MIETTDRDFQVVNAVSIIAIFLIIALVEKSLTLPFILIAVIEAAIFVNLGLPHYLGQSLPFIAPICISTIQLGATVDYAILMTTRYKVERIAGEDKKKAVHTALSTSIPSILVSGMGLFAATFGVALYSDLDIISSMCLLMARGAVISMLSVIFILPALLLLCDRLTCALLRGDREAAEAMCSRGQKKFMQSMKNFPAVIRTEYALALAAGDHGAVEAAQKRFEKCAKRYPYPSDIAGERELMGLVGEKW